MSYPIILHLHLFAALTILHNGSGTLQTTDGNGHPLLEGFGSARDMLEKDSNLFSDGFAGQLQPTLEGLPYKNLKLKVTLTETPPQQATPIVHLETEIDLQTKQDGSGTFQYRDPNGNVIDKGFDSAVSLVEGSPSTGYDGFAGFLQPVLNGLVGKEVQLDIKLEE